MSTKRKTRGSEATKDARKKPKALGSKATKNASTKHKAQNYKREATE